MNDRTTPDLLAERDRLSITLSGGGNEPTWIRIREIDVELSERRHLIDPSVSKARQPIPVIRMPRAATERGESTGEAFEQLRCAARPAVVDFVACPRRALDAYKRFETPREPTQQVGVTYVDHLFVNGAPNGTATSVKQGTFIGFLTDDRGLLAVVEYPDGTDDIVAISRITSVGGRAVIS